MSLLHILGVVLFLPLVLSIFLHLLRLPFSSSIPSSLFIFPLVHLLLSLLLLFVMEDAGYDATVTCSATVITSGWSLAGLIVREQCLYFHSGVQVHQLLIH